MLEVCKRAHLDPHIIFEGGQPDTPMAMAAAGTGVTLLPEMATRRYRNKDISLIEFAPAQPSRTLGIVQMRLRAFF
jgi:DNA-binding transcriptional LysR family regulator